MLFSHGISLLSGVPTSSRLRSTFQPPMMTPTLSLQTLAAGTLPIHCLLQRMPFEITDLIFTYTLNTYPKSHIPLLLTSKHINHVVTSAADSLAFRQAQREYPLAAQLFSPRYKENLLGSWLPRLSKSVKTIETVLLYWTRSFFLHFPDLLELESTLPMLVMGLYLIESINFSAPHHKAARIRSALSALPTYGVLLIRLTSVMLTMILTEEAGEALCFYDSSAPRASRAEDIILDPRTDLDIFVPAVENLLLRDGTSSFAETTLWLWSAEARSVPVHLLPATERRAEGKGVGEGQGGCCLDVLVQASRCKVQGKEDGCGC